MLVCDREVGGVVGLMMGLMGGGDEGCGGGSRGGGGRGGGYRRRGDGGSGGGGQKKSLLLRWLLLLQEVYWGVLVCGREVGGVGLMMGLMGGGDEGCGGGKRGG